MRLIVVALAVACSPDEPAPDCPSSIPSRLTPRSMEAVHWSNEGDCIEITYNPVFRDRERAVSDLAKQWIGLSCSETCFSGPFERATPEDGEAQYRTIHITELAMPAAAGMRTATTFIDTTGEITRALVMLDPALDNARFSHALMRGLGHAFGFDVAPIDVQSVMNPELGLWMLSELDVQAFCAKYGTCN